jgi:hypothetical protein
VKESPGVKRFVASFLRRHGYLLVLGALVIGVVGSAQAATSTKFYALSITSPTPAVVAINTSKTFTFRLTDCTSTSEPKCTQTSSQPVGSANIFIPVANFTVTAPTETAVPITASGGKNWTMRYAAGAIELRANTSKDVLSPGQSVSAPVTMTALGPLGTYSFDSVAKQANNFSGKLNDVVQLGADPEVEIVARICEPGDVECKANDGAGTTIQAPVPTAGQTVLTFVDDERACGDLTVGTVGSLGVVDPIGQSSQLDVTFTYDQAISQGVSQSVFCLSKDDGVSFFALGDCKNDAPPCIVRGGRTTGGALEYIVRIPPNDPWGGTGAG